MKTRNHSAKTRNHSRQVSSQVSNGGTQLDVIDRSVRRSGLTHASFVKALTSTALGRLAFWSQTDLERLLITAERLGLDPIGGDIYALDQKITSSDPSCPNPQMEGATYGHAQVKSHTDSTSNIESGIQDGLSASLTAPIILVLSVDGWSKLINSHAQFDGMHFQEFQETHGSQPTYIECTIYRKDRKVATSVREYMTEANTATGAWLTHPRRMLRHKAMVQCARICFGMGGLYESDEAERIRISAQFQSNTSTKSFSPGQESGRFYKLKVQNAKPMGTSELKNWLDRKGHQKAFI
jgi:hypothetical protein